MTDASLQRSDRLAQVEKQCRNIAEREKVVKAFVPGSIRCEEVLQALRRGKGGGPLWGYTIGVKDIFHVEGFVTGCGSGLPPELFQGAEAECVTRLKRAGAAVMGKTVTTEFAFLAPGATSNPHNPAHTPGGSSSGSAAGVAAGFFDFALGSQTVGSTNRPAAYCGVVGFKPSYELISRAGVFPFSQSADHIGVFCNSVAELDLIMPILATRKWLGLKNPLPGFEIKLGVPGRAYTGQAEDHGLKHFYALNARLVEEGVEVRPSGILENIAEINELHLDMIAAELYEVHQGWLGDYGGIYRAETKNMIDRGSKVSQERLGSGREMRQTLRRRLEDRMDALAIDAWICPPAPGEAPEGLASTGSGLMNLPWTMAGMPSISIPAGQGPHGLPLGLQVVGRFGDDEKLIALARGLEPLLAA